MSPSACFRHAAPVVPHLFSCAHALGVHSLLPGRVTSTRTAAATSILRVDPIVQWLSIPRTLAVHNAP
ncbi:hypothetical protein TIFTF001_026874 [Ficus carica]|uniref:Uncharacterized protein n=1 Tax=Ficus carica TaxID=3494 RepID=A0AA88IZA8_FICCA|nr:hypothetical protein TIFTF001_026874 [Ficus carica]